MYFGFKGNRNENSSSTMLFFLFTLFNIVVLIYFSFFVTYGLRIEMILGVIGLFFSILEALFGIIAFLKFKKDET